ncbi:MAG TPA: aldehyde dehydrogenase family protein [Gemmatimonadaceae bacterium]|nr:aldehyde dehydrogenase family protein [Gemmatimonadaceae bacterium]
MPTATPPLLQNFVHGAFRAATSDRWTPAINPSDASDVIAHVPEGTSDDVRAAVEAAQAALPAWRALSGPARAEHLHRWAAAIAARADELAQAMSREVGKPISEAKGEVGRCVVILRYYAGDAVREVGQVIPSQVAGALQFTLREPLGVVALITPWNFPLAIPLWKAAPALAFGNTVVLKPSEAASYVATLLAETAASAGLPAGVFNVVSGSGATVGMALLRADAVRAVSFTGSSAVGKTVAQVAAERNIRYQTELGGKNVVIVARDADLDLAAALTASGAMRYAGQKCTATSRVVVTADVQQDFLARLRAQVEKLPLGPVDDPSAAVGPLISEASRTRLRQALEEAEPERLFGGELPDDARFARGFYFAPLVIRLADPDSPIAQRELFGPVLGTLVASDLDEAIALANRTPYGLSASLFTRDVRTALRYVHRIEAGLVRVNADTTGVDPHAPFGGVKGSSSGSREQGPAAREFYTETKTVQINP